MEKMKRTDAKIRDGKQLLAMHNRSVYESIWQAYKEPSRAKEQAWLLCKALCDEYRGRSLKVLGRGTYTFSAAFLYDNNESGLLRIVYITKDHDRDYPTS